MLHPTLRTTLIVALTLLLPLSVVLADVPEPYPRDPAADKNELLITGGLDVLVPGLGVRYRQNGKYESVARLGLLRGVQSADLGFNLFADNPEPEKRGTWYFGPSVFYFHEDDNVGVFNLAYLNASAGREKRLSAHWRFNWEAGLGVMLFESVHTAGAPILFPVIPILRAEFLYQVI